MRLPLVSVSCLLGSFILQGGLRANDAPAMPIGATLVKAPEGKWPDEGNIQASYADGKIMVVTTDGRDSEPRVVEGGRIGWIHAIGQDPKYGCVKTVLILKSPDGLLKTWEGNALFIGEWTVIDNGAHLVIRSMEHHGHEFYIEYDLKSGQVLNSIDDFVSVANLPAWAKWVADPNDP